MPNPIIQSSVHPVIQSSKLVLFDIDGTIVVGGYPTSVGRFEHVFKKFLGRSFSINWQEFDGTTDFVIFKENLKRAGMEEELIEEKMEEVFEEAYSFFAKNIKSDYKKRLIKEARDLIKKLYFKKNIYLGLLTGNEENVARLKMNVLGLSDYFRFGLFGNEATNRFELAKLVFVKAKKILGIEFLAKDIYIIGDTPNDIKCGKAIGANTIGVATGNYSVANLKKAKANLVVKKLNDKRVLEFILS